MGKLIGLGVCALLILAACVSVVQNQSVLNIALASISPSSDIISATKKFPSNHETLYTSSFAKNFTRPNDVMPLTARNAQPLSINRSDFYGSNSSNSDVVNDADSNRSTTSNSEKNDGTISSNIINRKSFDCAVSWIRIPKTASTSVYQVFMHPLLQSGNFTSTSVTANACVMGVGGCSRFWNESEHQGDAGQIQPPFGTSVQKWVTDGEEKNGLYDDHGNRCFESADPKKNNNILCYEYDGIAETMDYGPHASLNKGVLGNLAYLSSMTVFEFRKKLDQGDHQLHLFSSDEINFHPHIEDHVGFDPSIIGWILPSNSMVFSAFRDPLDRFMSSFYYGIRYGASQPGQVKTCKLLHFPKYWRTNMTEARLRFAHDDTDKYLKMLEHYLRHCRNASYNVYTQFLDPNTKNLSVALQNMEQYVIVGLQNDTLGTLERWKNITIRSCHSHPKIRKIKRKLDYELKMHGMEKFNDRNSNNSTSVVLSSKAEFDKLGKKLQTMISDYISEDVVIYKRALELYEEQREWGL